MQDVIHRVMEAEGEARRILQDARTEAEHLISEAYQRAKESEKIARVEVRQQADALIEDAVNAAEEKKAEQLARAAQEVEAGVQIDDALYRDVVNAVVDCVAGMRPPG